MDEKLQSLIQRLESVTIKLEKFTSSGTITNPTTATESNSSNGNHPALLAFESIVNGSLKQYLNLSTSIGGLVKDQADHLQSAFTSQRDLILIAVNSKKPTDSDLMDLLKPLQSAIMETVDIKDKNRPSPLFNHLSAIAEGIPALGWVMVSPTPAPHISEFKDASQFYANRVIKENKEKNPVHVTWVKAYQELLSDLFTYVKEYHTTGLSWNPKGGEAKLASKSSTGGNGPPPPPVPTAAQLEAFSRTPTPKPAGGAALLSELSKGTSGLRKVDKSEMTHKNPELRTTSVVKVLDKPISSSPAKDKIASRGAPKCALEGNKWVVENQYDNPNIVIDQTELRQVVYAYNCHNSTVKVVGKVNAITIDGCKKFGLLIDNVVSTLDTVNSQRIQIQITGKCPTAVIDKTDGYQLYLSKDSEDIEILSAKSSEMNILALNKEGEYFEMPMCEQFKTHFRDGKLVTSAVEHKE